MQKLASKHIGEAAKTSGLTTRAETNTTNMLKGLLGSLGFTDVNISYSS